MNLEVSFPLQGLDQRWAVAAQPPLTSGSLSNVRPFDVMENRSRGGQRPGLVRWGTPNRLAGNRRIDRLVQIEFIIT